MKRSVLRFAAFASLIALLCGILPAAAQNHDKGLFVELNFGYARTSYHDWDNNNHALIVPAIGYRFANNWSVGARMQFETKNYSLAHEGFTTAAVFGQYRFLNLRRLSLFAEAAVSCSFVDHDYSKILVDGGSQKEWIARHPEYFSDTYAEAGVTFGASYRIWKGLRITARYLYLGYSGASAMRRSGGCWGDGNMILDAGWNRLQAGLQYTF